MDNLITNEMVAGEEFNAISMSDRYVNELLNLNSEQRIEVLINVIGKIHEDTEFKLGLSAIALDTAVACDPLDLGVSILSEVANALPIHVRVDEATETIGIETDLQFETTGILESVV